MTNCKTCDKPKCRKQINYGRCDGDLCNETMDHTIYTDKTRVDCHGHPAAPKCDGASPHGTGCCECWPNCSMTAPAEAPAGGWEERLNKVLWKNIDLSFNEMADRDEAAGKVTPRPMKPELQEELEAFIRSELSRASKEAEGKGYERGRAKWREERATEIEMRVKDAERRTWEKAVGAVESAIDSDDTKGEMNIWSLCVHAIKSAAKDSGIDVEV